ncbi:MAG TPA: dTDP-4-dehydrorhamnose 3,5-epimerase family protein [Candidatus Limnocylindrales bacterium]|nr:dTDP-4-dehydrorhamnose 3,5-epimerase family protein [Candidatus Limnocylindrales bacterium]
MHTPAPHLQPHAFIPDVWLAPITTFGDARGAFMETFRREWFPWVNWDRVQGNCSFSAAGVLRGLHYHHHQIDYWFVTRGDIRVALVDLRPSSPAYLRGTTLEIGDSNRVGLFVPSGVAHGFYALTDITLTYLVNNYYDGGDELGVAWNDAALNVDWGVEAPMLSTRDMKNPRLTDIAPERLPR